MFTLARAAVLLARTAGSEFGTARGRAGTQDPPYPTLRVSYHARLGIHTDQGCRDLGELHVRVAPGILWKRDELIEGPVLDPLRHRLRKHASPFDTSKWRCLSEGALCAGLSNRASDSNILPEHFLVQMLSGARFLFLSALRSRVDSSPNQHAGTALG